MGVSKATLYRYLQEAGMPTHKFPAKLGGTRGYVLRSDLEQLLEERRAHPETQA